MPNSAVDVLIIEDNGSERESIEESLRHALPNTRLTALGDGTSALDFLFCQGCYADRPRGNVPKLILLDLRLPGMNGHEVLKNVRARRETELVPVVVFSDSTNPRDVAKSYQSGANSYVSKPVGFGEFAKAVEDIAQYWLERNRAAS